MMIIILQFQMIMKRWFWRSKEWQRKWSTEFTHMSYWRLISKQPSMLTTRVSYSSLIWRCQLRKLTKLDYEDLKWLWVKLQLGNLKLSKLAQTKRSWRWWKPWVGKERVSENKSKVSSIHSLLLRQMPMLGSLSKAK